MKIQVLNKFGDDFLKLDHTTISDYFKIQEFGILIRAEPYLDEVLFDLYKLMFDFEGEEMYEWCAVIKKELAKR